MFVYSGSVFAKAHTQLPGTFRESTTRRLCVWVTSTCAVISNRPPNRHLTHTEASFSNLELPGGMQWLGSPLRGCRLLLKTSL